MTRSLEVDEGIVSDGHLTDMDVAAVRQEIQTFDEQPVDALRHDRLRHHGNVDYLAEVNQMLSRISIETIANNN